MGCVTSSSNVQVNRIKQQQIQRIKRQIQQRNKQISVMEKKNTQLKAKKHQRLQQITQEIRQDNIMLIEFDEDGQAETSNQDDANVGSLIKCTICQEEYNMIDRVPWMVCANQHTYCSSCIGGMTCRNQSKCPQCRQQITAGNRNAHICLLIQNITNKNGINSKKAINVSPPKEMIITISRSNKYNSQYSFPQPNTIIKGNDFNWYGLLFNEVLPAEGKFKFCIEVVFSLHNNVEVGIIDVASRVEKGKMSNKRVTYHLFDGRVMDSGHIDKPHTSWNPKGKKVPKGTYAKVVVLCDMDNNKIYWYINDELHAEGIISDYLKYAKAVPYLSMYHAEDVVIVNSW